MMWGGDWMGQGWGFGFGFGFALLHLVWWIVVIAAGALAVRWVLRESGGRRWPEPGRDAAEAILRERFARGEIDQREYDERLRVLGLGAGSRRIPEPPARPPA